MQLVFELADIEKDCENFVSHGNCLGLLKPASFLSMEFLYNHTSYNFLHKSIQEYMIAYHIASLPPKMLSDLLNKKFWDSSYFNVWVMYVGITGGEQREFKHFLSGSRFKFLTPNPSKISDKILKDKIKYLYLLRCAAEVKESKFLEPVQNVFEGKVIDLSNKTLSETNIKTLAVLLLDLPDGPWTLNLSRCNISNTHCKVLFETFFSRTVTSNINTVNISFNNISSENLYKLCYKIFGLWKTEEVILPIDALLDSATIEKTQYFVNTLAHTIQTYRLSLGKLMILYQPNQTRMIVLYSNLNYVKCFQLHNCELNEDLSKRLQRLVTEELKSYRIGHIYFSYYIYEHHDVKMLAYILENFKKIMVCGLNMHSKGAYLLDTASRIDFQIEKDPSTFLVDYLAAVLQNNVNTSSSYLLMLSEKVKEETKGSLRNISTVKVLDLANSNMSDSIADDIELILFCNNLEEIYLGTNGLQEEGMIKVAKALQNNSTLKVFDISNNSVNDKAANNIAESLVNKIKLEKIYLNGNQLQTESIIRILNCLCSTSLKIFDISQNMIDSRAASVIANVLIKNTQLVELHLGGNILQTKGVIEISLFLTHTATLNVFDISNNNISSEAADGIAQIVSNQVKLEILILGGNNLQDGLVVIIKKCHQTLKILDISNNNASIITTDKVAVFLCFQTKLEKLYFGGNNLVNAKTLQTLQYFLLLTTFDISCTNTSDEVKQDTRNVLPRHVTHIQSLLLAHNMEISVVDKYDVCRLPLPTAELSLKHDITKISGKYVAMCVQCFV